MTLGEVCDVGQEVLDAYPMWNISPKKRQVESIHEKFVFPLGDELTKEMVQEIVHKVLGQLEVLGDGIWTPSPHTLTIGGIEQRAIYRDNIAITFRLQFDSVKHQNVLIAGGSIFEGKPKTMTGR